MRVFRYGHLCCRAGHLRRHHPLAFQPPAKSGNGGIAMNPRTRADQLGSEITLDETRQLIGTGKPFGGWLVSIFGALLDGRVPLHSLLDLPDVGYREFQYLVTGPVRSMVAISPAASWHEREVHDQYGVEFTGHPALQPLLRHSRAEDDGAPTRGDSQFLKVQGEGVCEVPVGPVHAGVIEPGHFRFSVVGDTVLHLQLQLFYTHKGTEELLESTVATDAVPLAESVSGDNCFAHAVAYCRAVEEVSQVAVVGQANTIRIVGPLTQKLLPATA